MHLMFFGIIMEFSRQPTAFEAVNSYKMTPHAGASATIGGSFELDIYVIQQMISATCCHMPAFAFATLPAWLTVNIPEKFL